MEALSNKLSLFYLFLLFTMVFTMRRERNWKDVEDVVIYTKEIKERKEKLKTHTYLFCPAYLCSVATTYLVLEGVQVWRIGSSTYAIYTTKEKTDKRQLVHLHRPSRALLRLGSLEAIGSHGLQDIREKQ